jgi:hypothetical protein
LLGEDGAYQTDHRAIIRKDADHIGAALDLLVQAFDREPEVPTAPAAVRSMTTLSGGGETLKGADANLIEAEPFFETMHPDELRNYIEWSAVIGRDEPPKPAPAEG